MGVRYVYSTGDDGAVLKPTGQGLIEDRIYEILYADDCVLLAQSEEAMQIMLTVFDGISAQFGQQISVKKTKLMVVDRHRHPVIIVEDEEAKAKRWSRSKTHRGCSFGTSSWRSLPVLSIWDRWNTVRVRWTRRYANESSV
jgi:hypothetical protein